MFSTPHTSDTENPQDYGEHFRVAFCGSLKLIWYGLAGLVHAFLPEIRCLQFYTSSGIIKAYRMLEDSHRHDAEIARFFGAERLMVVKFERARWLDSVGLDFHD